MAEPSAPRLKSPFGGIKGPQAAPGGLIWSQLPPVGPTELG